MSDDRRLSVVLCWHMHQPQYRDTARGEYVLPWTYLHAIKDYVDMAAHLESVPGARAVVNFAPLLLEQIGDYARSCDRFLRGDEPPADPLLRALVAREVPRSPEERIALLRACLKANAERMVYPFADYRRLYDIARILDADPAGLEYVQDSFFSDLVVWYHLAWLGETVRRNDLRAQRLIGKGREFTHEDRLALFGILSEAIGGLICRYARLAASGAVELSVTPWGHPILPLMLDFETARDAWPEVMLPKHAHYPGGSERARWHIREGLKTFQRYFGFKPAGCWPAEGSVSVGALRMLSEAGFTWAASGEQVLRNSLARLGPLPDNRRLSWLYRPWRSPGNGATCFFRDDSISDRIGFEYSGWHADDAVSDLIYRLECVAARPNRTRENVVSIILDGENAWEYYPFNGYYFLNALYQRLADHPDIRLTTFSDHLEMCPSRRLGELAAGSWVFGNFSTWIGDPHKNQGWEMLCEAKRAYDRHSARLDAGKRSEAERLLGACEGSDWCWWFGDYNPANSVSDFERLYRTHLINLYHLLGEPAPAYLFDVIARGGGDALMGGVMRPGQAAAS